MSKCTCGCAEKLEQAVALANDAVSAMRHIQQMGINSSLPASTPLDQEQPVSCDRLTSAIMTDAAKSLKDCKEQMMAMGRGDLVLSGWIDDSIEALTKRAASLGDELQPIDKLELMARVKELEKALDITQLDYTPPKTAEGLRAWRIARKALKGKL